MKFTIHNMVITIKFSDRIDLNLLLKKLEGGEYVPDQFPGLVYRMKNPRVSFLVFSSGIMNCTGARSLNEAKNGIGKMLILFKQIGVKVYKPKIEVQNIVASAELGARLNLDTIAFNLENSEYEPEQFPGLVYRMDNPKVAFLLFGSGKIVCAGARNEKQIEKAIDYLVKKLKKVDAFNN
jgi:transcription initiation factor TFIID TATA-box-binding protein